MFWRHNAGKLFFSMVQWPRLIRVCFPAASFELLQLLRRFLSSVLFVHTGSTIRRFEWGDCRLFPSGLLFAFGETLDGDKCSFAGRRQSTLNFSVSECVSLVKSCSLLRNWNRQKCCPLTNVFLNLQGKGLKTEGKSHESKGLFTPETTDGWIDQTNWWIRPRIEPMHCSLWECPHLNFNSFPNSFRN